MSDNRKTETEISSTPIYHALTRPNLFMGGDREMVLLVIVVFGGIMVLGATVQPIASLICAATISSAIYCLRLAAKSDPRMRHKYLRSLQYKAVYRAHSRPYRET